MSINMAVGVVDAAAVMLVNVVVGVVDMMAVVLRSLLSPPFPSRVR